MAETAEQTVRPQARRGPFRPQRLALATESGKNIDACFGKTAQFLIYELRTEEMGFFYDFLETRPGPRPCRDQGHDQAVLEESAELLRDCGLVLAGRIGPAALKVLSDRGIMGLAAPLPINEALKRLAEK
jgi:predicted Fe-Mo cluster-binding NifX family protein